jgi:hypothetical protein
MVVSSVVRYCCTLCGLTVPPPLIAGFALECWSEASMYNLQVYYSFRRGVFSWSLLLLLVVRRTRYHVMKLKQNVVSSISHCGRFNNLVIWFPRSVSSLACFFMPLSQLFYRYKAWNNQFRFAKTRCRRQRASSACISELSRFAIHAFFPVFPHVVENKYNLECHEACSCQLTSSLVLGTTPFSPSPNDEDCVDLRSRIRNPQDLMVLVTKK